MSKKKKNVVGRCVHCLRNTNVVEGDHVFPDSWYPDSTPAHVQRWTAPSCPRCNREFGKTEKDLLIRLILCVDPKTEAAAGLSSKAMRSMGFDTQGLPERERLHREALKKKIKAEMIPRENLVGRSGQIPGLGPPDGEWSWAIPIPYAVLSMTAEKIARGCEWKLKGRYVEPPYGIHTFTRESEIVWPAHLQHHVQRFDFGPGCRIQRVSATEDPNTVRYSMTIWNALNFDVIIADQSDLKKDESEYQRPEGLDPAEVRGMRISPYLRTYED
jgi:hypothetical protein